MRQKFCFLVLVIFIGCFFISSAFGQDKVGANYRKGKMIEVMNLLSGEELDDCSADEYETYAGTVSAVRFTEGKQIGNFTVKTAKGSVKIYFSTMLYKRISKADANALPTLIAKGRSVTVDAHRCGKKITAAYIIAGIHTDRLG